MLVDVSIVESFLGPQGRGVASNVKRGGAAAADSAVFVVASQPGVILAKGTVWAMQGI
jgi:hypothetical protein